MIDEISKQEFEAYQKYLLKNKMTETIYLGNGWEDQYGNNVTINIEKLNQAIASGKLEVNKYGDVKLRVGKLKSQNEKSKATHYVAVPKPKNDLPF